MTEQPDIAIVVNLEGYVPLWDLVNQLLDYRDKWPDAVDDILSMLVLSRNVYHQDEIQDMIQLSGKLRVIE